MFGIENGDELPGLIKDPFKSDKITNIHMGYYKNWLGEGGYWWGEISFKNGNTEGKQKTPNCEDYPSLMVEMDKIVKSLK